MSYTVTRPMEIDTCEQSQDQSEHSVRDRLFSLFDTDIDQMRMEINRLRQEIEQERRDALKTVEVASERVKESREDLARAVREQIERGQALDKASCHLASIKTTQTGQQKTCKSAGLQADKKTAIGSECLHRLALASKRQGDVAKGTRTTSEILIENIYWTQTDQELSLSVFLNQAVASAKEIRCNFIDQNVVFISLREGEPLLQAKLYGKIIPLESVWTLIDRQEIQVSLWKAEHGSWDFAFSGEGQSEETIEFLEHSVATTAIGRDLTVQLFLSEDTKEKDNRKGRKPNVLQHLSVKPFWKEMFVDFSIKSNTVDTLSPQREDFIGLYRVKEPIVDGDSEAVNGLFTSKEIKESYLDMSYLSDEDVQNSVLTGRVWIRIPSSTSISSSSIDGSARFVCCYVDKSLKVLGQSEVFTFISDKVLSIARQRTKLMSPNALGQKKHNLLTADCSFNVHIEYLPNLKRYQLYIFSDEKAKGSEPYADRPKNVSDMLLKSSSVTLKQIGQAVLQVALASEDCSVLSNGEVFFQRTLHFEHEIVIKSEKHGVTVHDDHISIIIPLMDHKTSQCDASSNHTSESLPHVWDNTRLLPVAEEAKRQQAQLERELSVTSLDHLSCRFCSAPLLSPCPPDMSSLVGGRLSSLRQALPLPSSHWQEMTDYWSSCVEVLKDVHRDDIVAQRHRCFVGESYIMLHRDDILPDAVIMEEDMSLEGISEEHRPQASDLATVCFCGRCQSLLGRMLPDGHTFELFKMFLHAAGNDPEGKKMLSKDGSTKINISQNTLAVNVFAPYTLVTSFTSFLIERMDHFGEFRFGIAVSKNSAAAFPQCFPDGETESSAENFPGVRDCQSSWQYVALIQLLSWNLKIQHDAGAQRLSHSEVQREAAGFQSVIKVHVMEVPQRCEMTAIPSENQLMLARSFSRGDASILISVDCWDEVRSSLDKHRNCLPPACRSLSNLISSPQRQRLDGYVSYLHVA